jgi:hypothetical protein
MRTLILVAALALMSTASHAGQSRSLSLASAEPTQSVSEPPAKPAPVETPHATTDSSKPSRVTETSTETTKPKKKPVSTESRVIYELHRHGIYW